MRDHRGLKSAVEKDVESEFFEASEMFGGSQRRVDSFMFPVARQQRAEMVSLLSQMRFHLPERLFPSTQRPCSPAREDFEIVGLQA